MIFTIGHIIIVSIRVVGVGTQLVLLPIGQAVVVHILEAVVSKGVGSVSEFPLVGQPILVRIHGVLWVSWCDIIAIKKTIGVAVGFAGVGT